ncbi:MAG TPA: RNB domain-containing ribonuclease, partial [Peptostreptococcaceae bacterium]|nr:RNB domain-containing ribonuclease [Peptostreptococcaceae bacterium]
EKLMETFENLVSHFENSEKLARILMKRREVRGAIDFDFPEAKIILNKEGEVVDIKKYERRISNKIIEEFMLISNETIAEHFFWLNIPFVYRIHETPSIEKMEQLSKFISTFGYHIKGSLEDVQPKVLQDIIHKLHGKPEARAINTIMLRSLKQAKYSPESLGHFGLAAKYYSHFTSPIRRYPDLQIHRIIKEFLNNKITPKRHEALKGIVDYSSTQSSTRERAADEAERDVHDIFKAKYMSNKVGQVYEGVISSVTSFGIFVELDNTVEGLIRVVNMHDDYYIFDDSSYTLIGERTKKMYKIGDKLKIKVDKVNVDFKEIDFALVEEGEEGEE